MGLLVLLKSSGTLFKKYVLLSVRTHSTITIPHSAKYPSRGRAPGAQRSLESSLQAGAEVCGDVKAAGQVRGQTSCDAQKGGEGWRKSGWEMHFLGETQSAILDSGSSSLSSQEDYRNGNILLFPFS